MTTFKKPKRWVNRVFIHCSASDNPAHDDVSVMRRWHLQRKFNDVGYHFFIKKNGTVQVGRPIEKTPAAQRGHNRGTIAICLHGLEESKFTKAQFESLRGLCMEIDKAYDHKITFHGHNEVAAKLCPVFDYKKILQLTKTGLLGLKKTDKEIVAQENAPIDPIEEQPKPLTKSTTVQAAIATGTAVTSGVVTVANNVDKLSGTQTGMLILCGVVIVGCLFWVIRERARRGQEFSF